MLSSNKPIRTLGILMFDDFELLDVTGPVEMFGSIPEKIKIVLIAENKGLKKSSQSISIMADLNFDETPALDILLIPGGMGTRREVNNEKLLAWISDNAKKAELTISVCTGSALLAKAGVLNEHRATSNKNAFSWVMEQSKNALWVKKARWVDDGNVITSSGVASGIDMSLYVIERLYGVETRNDVINQTEYVFNSDANADPFYKPA
jgi:transcriptional regulator GlxA family with amidase domain